MTARDPQSEPPNQHQPSAQHKLADAESPPRRVRALAGGGVHLAVDQRAGCQRAGRQPAVDQPSRRGPSGRRLWTVKRPVGGGAGVAGGAAFVATQVLGGSLEDTMGPAFEVDEASYTPAMRDALALKQKKASLKYKFGERDLQTRAKP